MFDSGVIIYFLHNHSLFYAHWMNTLVTPNFFSLVFAHRHVSFFSPSSRDELQPPAERFLPSPAAGAHGRVPAHEDAQEDPGTPVVRVLRDLRQDGAAYFHGKAAASACVDLSWDASRCL